MFNIGRKIAALAGAGALIAASVLPVFAQNTGAVTATVTPQNISVTVSPASVAYGTLALSQSNTNRTTAPSALITATNNGNVAENFNIKGSDATGGTSAWVLNDAPDNTLNDGTAIGTVAVNQYVHRYDNTTGGSFNTLEARPLNNTNYKPFASGVAVNGAFNLVLQMNMPTGSTDASAQKSTTVTVLAVSFF